jgi:hypothetical protein
MFQTVTHFSDSILTLKIQGSNTSHSFQLPTTTPQRRQRPPVPTHWFGVAVGKFHHGVRASSRAPLPLCPSPPEDSIHPSINQSTEKEVKHSHQKERKNMTGSLMDGFIGQDDDDGAPTVQVKEGRGVFRQDGSACDAFSGDVLPGS